MGKLLRILGLGDLSGKGFQVHLAFWSMILMTFFLFGDQNAAAANLSRIGSDFGMLEQTEYRWYLGGVVSIFFFVLGTIISLATGVMTDMWNRKKILFWCVFIGEIPCVLTGFSTTYGEFLLYRTLTGIGLGGAFPVMFSLLGDFFRTENRPTASAWVGLAMGLGIAAGQVLGGTLAHLEFLGLEGWRWTFILIAVPSFPLAILFLFFGRVPERGSADLREVGAKSEVVSEAAEVVEPAAVHKFSKDDLKRVFANKTNLLTFAQGIPGTVPWGLLFVYFVDFFETSRGFDVNQANMLVLGFAVMSIFGGFAGGFLGKLFYQLKRNYLVLFCATTVILGSIPVFMMINYEGTSLLPVFILSLVGGFIVPMTGANARAILINVNLPENRGSVFAIFNLADGIGKGLGPFVIGALLIIMPETLAYNLSIGGWILCGLIWFGMLWTMTGDEDFVRLTMKGRGTV